MEAGSEPRLRLVGVDHPDARHLQEAQQAELGELFGFRGFALADPPQFRVPLGAFLVVYTDGEAIACGGSAASGPPFTRNELSPGVSQLTGIRLGTAPFDPMLVTEYAIWFHTGRVCAHVPVAAVNRAFSFSSWGKRDSMPPKWKSTLWPRCLRAPWWKLVN